MRHLLLILALLALPNPPAQARTVTDSAGREVEIPDEVTTVFAAGPPAAFFLQANMGQVLQSVARSRADQRHARPCESHIHADVHPQLRPRLVALAGSHCLIQKSEP